LILKGKKSNTYKKLNFYRKAAQLFALAFLVMVPVLVVNGIYSIMGNLYSITIFGFDIVDPAMALQTTFLTRELIMVLLAGIIIPVVLALIFGRVFCSWMCPFNTISEYWHKVTGKIFPARARRNKRQSIENNPHPYIYWVILIFLFSLTVVVDFPIITFFSAPGILSAGISQYVMGMGLGFEFFLVLSIIVVEGIILKRYFCKFVCPVGGVLSIFRTPATLRINHREDLCSCGANAEPCSGSCPLELSPKKKNLYPYCFNCGLCIKSCEKTGFGAISFGFNKSDSKKIKRYHSEKEMVL
jgi:ferredoxin-type protein NapH